MTDPEVALIVRSLTAAHGRVILRLKGIEDEEWFWEPVPDCWSVRPRSETKTEWANGSGAWVIDYGPEVSPAPFTTIAWRVAHVASTTAGYLDMISGWDWSAGTPWDRYAAPETAEAGMAFYAEQATRLVDFCRSIGPEDLDREILIPWRDPAPICEILEILLSEAFHHAAEVGVLRDLYRWTGDRQLA